MECNGQLFEIATYRDLYIALGQTNRVPDYRGLFLRGHGSQTHIQNNGSLIGNTRTTHTSGPLGQIQGDAIRQFVGTCSYVGNVAIDRFDGIFCDAGTRDGYGVGSANGMCDDIALDSARVLPTANEVRVVNTAVRYLIRSLP